MNKSAKPALFLTVLVFLSFKADAQHNALRPTPVHQSSAAAWMIEAWSGDNRPYKEIRQQINAAAANEQNLVALTQQGQAAAKKNPYDPKTEYRYAYALYRAAIETKPFNANNLIPVRDALQRGYPPHVYDYTRLRFLVESTLFPNQGLIPVGTRLYNHDLQDTSVKRSLTRVLTCSTSMSNLKTAVTYAQDLVSEKPKDADYHGTLAGAYLDLWFETKSQSYLKQAIAQYQEYLALAPADAEYRKTAARLVKTLQPMRNK